MMYNSYYVIQVLQNIRTNVKSVKCGPCISLYLPGLREYTADYLTPDIEKELKAEILDMGGSVNKSGLFLATTSDAMVVTSKTGVNRRSVASIPRDKIAKGLLREIDHCKFSNKICACLSFNLI